MASMAPSTYLPYLPPLEVPHEREGLGRELELVLHEVVNLSLIGKQLHWAVFGPLSRPAHLQLAGMVDSWRGLVDTVAERALALGFVPDGQAQAVVAGAQLTPVAQGAIEDHVVVHELTRRIADVSERVRARLKQVGEVDLVSQNVLIEVVRKLEKQQWMLRIQLKERV
jgi:starvation-inducible DNA-binding protein